MAPPNYHKKRAHEEKKLEAGPDHHAARHGALACWSGFAQPGVVTPKDREAFLAALWAILGAARPDQRTTRRRE
jgi:hypothetical protein